MKKRIQTTVVLTDAQLDYLERMTEKHALPDVSKTLRCLVAFAMAEADQESAIFETIRCASPTECDSGRAATDA